MPKTRIAQTAVMFTFLLLLPNSLCQSEPVKSDTPAIRVILLGTGSGPVVRLKRYGPSTLVQAGGDTLLFDSGRGVLMRATEAGIPLESITKVFLTHLHSDHVVDIPDLMLSPWAARSARKVPLEVWGPTGTQSMTDNLQKAFAYDIHIRRDVDEKFAADGIKVVSQDVQQGTVYEKNGVKITAFFVDHGPVKPSLGYRIDYGGRSIVISGDTRPSENLVRFSKGADVLIHETLDPEAFRSVATNQNVQQQDNIIAHHTTPEQAGEIFSKVKPKLAVYSHCEGSPALVTKTRKTYDGPLELGEDLMIINVGNTVDVRRPGK